MDAERYLRQILLAEIGEPGQRAIAEASVTVGGPAGAHEAARLYAERAGFRRIDDAGEEREPGSGDAAIVTPAARDVVAGARAVARAMVAAGTKGRRP
ncbi:MAG: hypothetical protein HOV80_24380 [Polyangiaceae bacterium]|nr:hypothetical protein [Polyangiaceae bacterium]